MTADGLQNLSDTYWKSAQTTYLAAADYYDRQEEALRSLLAELPGLEEGLDIGCGDGRYTLVAAGFDIRMTGLDLSANLIELARKRQSDSSVPEALCRFDTGRVETLAGGRVFDLVMCLGVTSALIDDAAFDSALDGLSSSCKTGGWLVMKDTVSLTEDRVAQTDNYVARYRHRDTYLEAISERGFSLSKEVYLMEPDGKHSNSMILFQKTS